MRFHFTKYILPPLSDNNDDVDRDSNNDHDNSNQYNNSDNEKKYSNKSKSQGHDLLHELSAEECVCVLYQTVDRLLQASADSVNSNKINPTGTASSGEDKTTALIARRFNSSARALPPIKPWDYLLRLHHYCPMSQSVYLSASLYLTRLCGSPSSSSNDDNATPAVALTPLNVHRLLLTALRVACKVIEDINFKQRRYASVAGVSTLDLYRLEIALLFLLDFDVFTEMNGLRAHLRDLQRLAGAEKKKNSDTDAAAKHQ